MSRSPNIPSAAITARIKTCTDSIAANPEDFTMLAIRGVLYDMIQHYDLAIRDFNFLLEKQPDKRHYYFLRAFTFCNKGEYELAQGDLRSVFKVQSTEDIQGIQNSSIPHLIFYVKTQRNRVLQEIEARLKKENLRKKYNVSSNISLS